MSCECRCEFDGREYDSKEKWKNDKYQCDCNLKKDYVWNSSTRASKCDRNWDMR